MANARVARPTSADRALRDGRAVLRGNDRPRLTTPLWLLAVYAASTALRIALAQKIHNPFVFLDELAYPRLAQSIASGHGLVLFGKAGFSYPPLYSLLLAPIYALHASATTAYTWIKIVNPLVMSAAIFPL